MLNRQLTQTMLFAATLAACASAPVQEMSDARQAINAAEAADAAQRSPQEMIAAQRALLKAQTSLEKGAYAEARRLALEAREQAIQARQVAAKRPALQATPLPDQP